jgi:hypothetical protein
MVQLCVFASISSNVYGVDGVVLIDQKRAMQGGVSSEDAPGFPVTISQPGSYRLSGNLTVPDASTTGIEITANHVTLDLNGFAIIGPNVCTGSPVTCTFSGGGVGIHAGSFQVGIVAPDGVRVVNGSVRGMGFHGVRLMGSGTVVEGVTTENNGGPGIVVGTGSVIDSSAISNGGTTGIIALNVRGSIASENRGIGIFVRPGGVASGNSSSQNGGDGITTTKGTLRGNSATLNKGFGMSVTCPASVVGNVALDNTLGNLRLLGAGCVGTDNVQ